MPKRKREDNPEELLTRYRDELHHALKAAKGFERQRLSKRVRDPKATADKKARLQNEIFVLKSLDLHQAAHAHLCSALLRFKSIAESPKLPAEIKAGIPKPDLTEDEKAALHNVTSSLCGRIEVRTVLDRAVAGICTAIGVPVPEKKGKGKKPAKDEATPGAKGKEKEQAKLKSGKGLESKIDVEEEERAIAELDDLLASSDDEGDAPNREALKRAARSRKPVPGDPDPMEIREDEDADEESDDAEVDDDDALDPMAITSDEGEDSGSDAGSDAGSDVGSDSGSESSFVGFDDQEPQLKTRTKRAKPPASDSGSDFGDNRVASPDSDAGSDSGSDSGSGPDVLPPRKKSKESKVAPITGPLTGSTFLPSLMGGYISGSGSDISDIDMAPRKNRRGQRARQAIWEKRYKQEALHLKKEAAAALTWGRDSGWDAKRGAVDGDSGKPWKRGIRNPLGARGQRGAEEPVVEQKKREPPVRKRDDEGPLHPSWEAKRKAKEQMEKSIAFQGTKITFD
ncbi:Bud-site selection protein [Lasiosphaeris hirsuta]|uniref:Bud-site selection protein n=1 Tax=Lasiosphaeris hirsuta TaxID=260670 RepID=A0AA40DLH1_9PEZI|nr:Bud-site selection protein [Lasiosphaeris hirsuta]